MVPVHGASLFRPMKLITYLFPSRNQGTSDPKSSNRVRYNDALLFVIERSYFKHHICPARRRRDMGTTFAYQVKLATSLGLRDL